MQKFETCFGKNYGFSQSHWNNKCHLQGQIKYCLTKNFLFFGNKILMCPNTDPGGSQQNVLGGTTQCYPCLQQIVKNFCIHTKT